MKQAFSGRDIRSYPWWQGLAFVAMVGAFLYLTQQLTAPYIAGDDWPFLLPASQQGGQSLPWANTLAEGRWINYLWYFISVHLTAEAGNILFVIAYIAMSCAAAALVSTRRLFLLCALALFFSPMFSELSLWPNSLFCGTALCGIALFALLRFDERFAPHVLFVATFALVLAYPPIATIVLLAAAARQAEPTVRSNIILAVAFLVAFAASVLAAYGLNALFHGYFGIKVAPWRDPHPLHSAADLGANLHIVATHWQDHARRYWVSMACIAIAGTMAVSWKQTRARGLSLIFALMVCWCVTVGIAVIAGVGNPGRALVWLWVAACFLSMLVASQHVPVCRYAGMVLLLVLVGYGGMFAWQNYRRYRPVVAYISMVIEAVSHDRGNAGATTMALAGNLSQVPKAWPVPGGHWPSPGLEWIIWKRLGVTLQRCDYVVCTAARQYLLSHGINRPTVIQMNGQPVLALNAYRPDGILRNYPSIEQEAELHLAYPAFLRYEPDVVRIAPFYPGTSQTPVSIALPYRKSGYTLRNEGASCKYPVDYRVTDNQGTTLATGQYKSPGSITIAKTDDNDGTTLLSLRMAAEAKNNYGCNIVVAANP